MQSGIIAMAYQVGRYPGVAEKLQSLAKLATLAGIRKSYVDALRTMLVRLENDPLEWGDPLYRVPHQSGIVCHSLVWPIMVRYSVHESANVVLIIDVSPCFDWPIRS
jgi:hypothetical protein